MGINRIKSWLTGRSCCLVLAVRTCISISGWVSAMLDSRGDLALPYFWRVWRGMNEGFALLQHRILFLGGEVTKETANRLIAQLLLLDADDPAKPIDLYVNSPGGSVVDGVAIIDAMRCIRAPVGTTCIGQAASMGAWILAAGAPGRRYLSPNAEVMIHQVGSSFGGRAADIEVFAQHTLRLQASLVAMLAEWTGQSPERIRTDMARDCFMTAEEARDYGLADLVLEPCVQSGPAGRADDGTLSDSQVDAS
nr:ATP-dependent Clp protease proteolytic subunit [Thiocapsa sp. KS1]